MNAKTPKTLRRPSASPKPVKAAAKPEAKTATKAAAAKKPAAPRVQKPSVPKYDFSTAYTGASGGLTSNQSRTAVDLNRFGTLTDAPLTDRDQKVLEGIRSQFGAKEFERRNIDTGILRRLGERGCLVHVAGSDVDPMAKFRLTNKGLGKADRKAA